MSLVLHGYWRSAAAYRVRIALNLKGVAYDQVTHDLRSGAQHDPDYLALAPHGLVPALQAPGATLIESPAILEWLEERYPSPALLPRSPEERALVRAMAALIGCDIHPLHNLRVQQALTTDLGATPAQVASWINRWIATGLRALEPLIERHGGEYAYGDSPTLADCYLVPQVYSAVRFGVDLSPFPSIAAISERCGRLEPFLLAHPDHQPDSD